MRFVIKSAQTSLKFVTNTEKYRRAPIHERRYYISMANALGLLQSCTKPLISYGVHSSWRSEWSRTTIFHSRTRPFSTPFIWSLYYLHQIQNVAPMKIWIRYRYFWKSEASLHRIYEVCNNHTSVPFIHKLDGSGCSDLWFCANSWLLQYISLNATELVVWHYCTCGQGTTAIRDKTVIGSTMYHFSRNAIFLRTSSQACMFTSGQSLHWRLNDHDGVSNHQPHGCLLNRLFKRRSKKTSKLRVTGLSAGNSPGPVNSPHKGPITRKMFPFSDVIMYRAENVPGSAMKMLVWNQSDHELWTPYTPMDLHFPVFSVRVTNHKKIQNLCTFDKNLDRITNRGDS